MKEQTYIEYLAHMLDEAMRDEISEARDNGKGEIDYENPSDTDLFNAIAFAKSELNKDFEHYYGKLVDFNKFSDLGKRKLIYFFLNHDHTDKSVSGGYDGRSLFPKKYNAWEYLFGD